ncbi:hypothetical protein GCM10010341_08040 [Streptomyces noursei]|nr:hypothetical protein GCM10010341_08040 [Streptomyces noursei]
MKEPTTNRVLLIAALQAAVPVHIVELGSLPDDELVRIAQTSGMYLGSHGDQLLFRSPKKGTAALAFNQLARGLAAAALVAEGGVTFANLHWCTARNCPGSEHHRVDEE